jgi:hypothetical protein
VKKYFPQPAGVLITLAFLILVTALVPPERALGGNLGIVMLHGAWVWAGLITFSLAALSGLAGLISGQEKWHAWSRTLGWVGLAFWLTYLPMSVLVQQLNWGGIFWDEPRFRIPLAFGVAGVLLQGGLWLVNRRVWTSTGNLIFGAALVWQLMGAQNVLHPDSPVLTSDSTRIKFFFTILVILALLLGVQAANWLYHRSTTPVSK